MNISFNTSLRDGTKVLVRPVEPSDKHLLEMGLEHLSQRSRYFRFFGPISRLSDSMLDKFTSVDQIDHIAVGAIDLTCAAETTPAGVARCIRLNETTDAEVAVAVIDSHQGKGLGTILLATVARAAAASGITTFVASVLNDNHAMLKLFEELGATSRHDGAGVMSVRAPVYLDPAKYPDTPVGRSFRNVYALINKAPEIKT